MAVLAVVMGIMGFLLLVVAVVYVVRQARFADPGTDYEAMQTKAETFFGRSGGGGV